MSEPTRIILHPCDWRSKANFYDEILPQLGAPDWHWRNLDALEDSLVAGQINRVEPPLLIEIYKPDQAARFTAAIIEAMTDIAREASQSGRMISIEIT
ncbi:barstar family protein [Parasphingopyxis sp. CP4]|uniref:barstar family protein n=1 Tax=Parasphingopyxis sp. CP4 TaxID=2724527 RepID=UPI00159FD0FB|nr:barstar family protein [Parasphingopyxis sp. CP4]QLC22766.1 barstar family protein [Parasphingopyxis sp. CP4]